MTQFKRFSGPSYTLNNIQYECQRAVNLYPEMNELINTGPDGEPTHLRSRYGLTPAQTSVVFDGPCRGKYVTTNGLALSIFGNVVYQITGTEPPFTYTAIGQLKTTSGIINHLAFADNGVFLLFTDGTYGYYAIISSQANLISSGQISNGGTDYTIGKYVNVALTGGSGSGATANISVSQAGIIQSFGTIVPGSGYTHSGLYLDVPLTGSSSGSGATANILVAGGVVSGGTITSSGTNYGGTITVTKYKISINPVTKEDTTTAYTTTQLYSGTITNVPLTGGSGSGATANIEVSLGLITSVTLINGGTGYITGDVLSISNSFTNSNGSGFQYTVTAQEGVQGLTLVNGGANYSAQDILTADNIYLGGDGTGFSVAISSLDSGTVTGVEIVSPGVNYVAGDVLSATLGSSGSGFQFLVNSVVSYPKNVISNLQQITDSTFLSYGPTNCCQYYDGFFIFNQTGTNNFFWSNENEPTFTNNGTQQAGTDSKIGATDPIVFLCVINRYLWLVGEQTTEIWYDQPSGSFIFQRIEGPFIEQGCVDANTAQKTEDGLLWLSQSKRGNLQVLLASGETVTPVSNQGVSYALSKYALSGWSSYSYGQDNHMFYCLNPPNGTSTWCFDITTTSLAGQSMWHERTYLNNGQEERALVDNIIPFNGYLIAGDYKSPYDYYFDPTNWTDNGVAIQRLRTAPHIADDMLMVYHNLFQLYCKTGVGTVTDNGVQRAPLVSLRWSDNGGVTYGNYLTQSVGQTGEYIHREQFWSLGLCEGSSRVYEVLYTDPTDFDIIGAALELTPANR